MVTFNHRDNRPIYSQIVDSFRERIAAGVLQPGEKLPSVRELAAELAINPNTIQRAYRELESAGWVQSQPGKGCFVTGIPGASPKTELLNAFDDAAAALLQLGMTREELIRRLTEGGNDLA